MHIIDRRLNPKAKSLGNRQRFIRRARDEIRNAVSEALKKRKISEVESGEKIRIRAKSLNEPSFRLGKDGSRDFVLPGNKEFVVGDTIPKPPEGGGGGGGRGAPDGHGEDDFVFTLSKDEFLDLFFEDLKLPNLIKVKLKDVRSPTPIRAGYTTDGSPSKLNRVRTMRNSVARRIALRRPSNEEIRAAEEALAAAEADPAFDPSELVLLRERLNRLNHLRKTVAFIDPFDLKYNRFERLPKPITQAVMFCLMDTSASMTQSLKDLAKRFFMLLHIFLTRHYREVDVVFIRHTSVASEVDEDTFFRSTETGGTVISSAFEEMRKVVKERYPSDEWNIYAAQASDGANDLGDMARCIDMLDEVILPVCQYFAYIEVGTHISESIIWTGFSPLTNSHKHFAMRHVSSPGDIYPVFHDLFSTPERA
ncbi:MULTISPECIES: YeaH/YhbH family protein [Rhodomicrobium]|uniref:YeaH/YhbH family protein n=1 Tax=Rhodomicrobium TaxID=1068 RepID=UPI000B4C1B6C|nr:MULTISPECIES: YeaH/YhbH family protein [Rhodomicrobium]